MARFKRRFAVAEISGDGEEKILVIKEVSCTKEGVKEIKAQGEDGKRYVVVALCSPVYVVKVQQVRDAQIKEAPDG